MNTPGTTAAVRARHDTSLPLPLRPSAGLLSGLVLLGLVACQSSTSAQQTEPSKADTSLVVPAPEPRMSPMAVAAATLDDGTYVKVVYSSPRKRGRTIFGGLVPFGEVWRTGANEATEITVTKPVRLGPRRLEAGTYSLFTIPGVEQWTIVINENLGQWGAYDYDPEADLVRFEVDVRQADKTHEAFTIYVDSETEAGIRLVWDVTEVWIPLGEDR